MHNPVDTFATNFVGKSRQIQSLRETVGRLNELAPEQQDITILLRGETGVGKDELAKLLHRSSHRGEKPLIPINCPAITTTLAESTLFGHERNAFTGAASARPGLISAADGGTLFFDEIADMNSELQQKILRFLDDSNGSKREVLPVGKTTSNFVDVRIIAATNKNLEQLVKNGQFREDLYYRINVMTLEIPPLREREEDIRPLTQYFLGEREITKPALKKLIRHPWPGNVRELKHVLQAAVFYASLAKQSHIDENNIDLVKNIDSGHYIKILAELPYSHHKKMDEVEKTLLLKALAANNNNAAATARSLDLSRLSLYDMFKRLGIKIDRP